jgi:3-keto-5-aminohexanoate cleavage enzyme
MPAALPRIMIAPTGARRTKADHPALPVTIPQIVEAARTCALAGADGIHAHVRDADGLHVLNAGLYRELLAELARVVPDMFAQVTSESAGRYAPSEQRVLVRDLEPRFVSIAVREMLPDASEHDAGRAFYHWAAGAGVTIQHIVYSKAELAGFFDLCAAGIIPGGRHQIQLVLGSYDGRTTSRPEDISPLVETISKAAPEQSVDWGLCAFGKAETACLVRAVALGGKARIGFENSLWNSDGLLAEDNAGRVAAFVEAMGQGT